MECIRSGTDVEGDCSDTIGQVIWLGTAALCAGEATGPATFSLNVSVPVNSAARVTVPLGACGKGMITESGAQVWPTVSVGEAAPAGFLLGERGGAQPDHLPDGIAAITFDVGSGSYAFHAQ